jgi:hypothetical protein
MTPFADSVTGRSVARKVLVGSGVAFALWRCEKCGCIKFQGWAPPTWINAVARVVEEIRRELDAAYEAAGYSGSWRDRATDYSGRLASEGPHRPLETEGTP